MTDDHQPVTSNSGPSDPERRGVLAGLLTAYSASLIPWALAQPVSTAAQGAFIAVSAMLVGRRSLDAGLAARLYGALAAESPQFAPDVSALLALINRQHFDPARLQDKLDTTRSPLAPLPRKIMRAWCLGIVGEGEFARCLAYEEAMDAVIVSDVLKPPTYAYGPYGSWSEPPVSTGIDGNDHTDVG